MVVADLVGKVDEAEELVGPLRLGLRLAGHEVPLLVPARHGHALHLLEVGGELLDGLDDRLLDLLAEGVLDHVLAQLAVDVGAPGLVGLELQLPGLRAGALVLFPLGEGLTLGVLALLDAALELGRVDLGDDLDLGDH